MSDRCQFTVLEEAPPDFSANGSVMLIYWSNPDSRVRYARLSLDLQTLISDILLEDIGVSVGYDSFQPIVIGNTVYLQRNFSTFVDGFDMTTGEHVDTFTDTEIGVQYRFHAETETHRYYSDGSNIVKMSLTPERTKELIPMTGGFPGTVDDYHNSAWFAEKTALGFRDGYLFYLVDLDGNYTGEFYDMTGITPGYTLPDNRSVAVTDDGYGATALGGTNGIFYDFVETGTDGVPFGTSKNLETLAGLSEVWTSIAVTDGEFFYFENRYGEYNTGNAGSIIKTDKLGNHVANSVPLANGYGTRYHSCLKILWD